MASHYQWKEVTPVLLYVNLFCTFVLLPLGLYNGIREGYVQLFTHRASTKRHALDFFQITTLIGLVYLNFGHVLPAEHEFSLMWKAPFDVNGPVSARAAAEWLHHAHWVVFIVNVALALWPFFKFGHPSGRPELEQPQQQQKPKSQ